MHVPSFQQHPFLGTIAPHSFSRHQQFDHHQQFDPHCASSTVNSGGLSQYDIQQSIPRILHHFSSMLQSEKAGKRVKTEICTYPDT
jgi:hypothetical protein